VPRVGQNVCADVKPEVDDLNFRQELASSTPPVSYHTVQSVTAHAAAQDHAKQPHARQRGCSHS
jgi:hypothetical protein